MEVVVEVDDTEELLQVDRHMAQKVLLSLTSLIIILLLSEFIIQKFKPQMTFYQAEEYSFTCHEKDDLLPFVLRQSSRCRSADFNGDYDTFITTNSLGYRGKEFTQQKPQGKKRILILGDSFTVGLGVSDGQTYPDQLGDILEEKVPGRFEVINAGYADSFSPDSYFVYLKNRGLALSPDMIIMSFFVYNDISDLTETVWKEVDEEGLPEKVTSCCRVVDEGILRNISIDFKYKYPYIRDSHLYLAAIDVLEKNFGLFKTQLLHPKRNDFYGCEMFSSCIYRFYPEEQKVKKVFIAVKKLVDERNIPLVALIIPADFQLDPQGNRYVYKWPKDEDVNFIQKRMGNFFNQNSIQYIDLYPIFDAQKGRGEAYFSHDAHFNPLGHRITAEAIFEFLQQNKLLVSG